MQKRNWIEVNVEFRGDLLNSCPFIIVLAPVLQEMKTVFLSLLFPTALECILSSGMRPIRMLLQLNGRLNLQVSS